MADNRHCQYFSENTKYISFYDVFNKNIPRAVK